MSIGKIIKPSEGNRWYSLEPLPHFCNDYRWKQVNESNLDKKLEVAEYLWTCEYYDHKYSPDCSVPLLCHLTVPFGYDYERDYPDENSKLYDRFCLEEIGFEFLTFDDEGWTDLSMLCKVNEADYIIRRIRVEMKSLKFDADKVKYFFENRVQRFEQHRCPRCKNICLIKEVYCSVCGLQVGLELMNWSRDNSENPPLEEAKQEDDSVKTSESTLKDCQ